MKRAYRDLNVKYNSIPKEGWARQQEKTKAIKEKATHSYGAHQGNLSVNCMLAITVITAAFLGVIMTLCVPNGFGGECLYSEERQVNCHVSGSKKRYMCMRICVQVCVCAIYTYISYRRHTLCVKIDLSAQRKMSMANIWATNSNPDSVPALLQPSHSSFPKE
jgi:hypothetical protein